MIFHDLCQLLLYQQWQVCYLILQPFFLKNVRLSQWIVGKKQSLRKTPFVPIQGQHPSEAVFKSRFHHSCVTSSSRSLPHFGLVCGLCSRKRIRLLRELGQTPKVWFILLRPVNALSAAWPVSSLRSEERLYFCVVSVALCCSAV